MNRSIYYRLSLTLLSVSATVNLLFEQGACAQSAITAGTVGTGPVLSAAAESQSSLVADARISPPTGTILPTDVLPLPTIQNRMTFGENLQLRILQKLPARFYFSGSCETSFRLETNPFQFPTKRKFLTQLPAPPIIRQLDPFAQGRILNLVGLCGQNDMVFRVLPNVTGGWTLTPHTRLFANYFMIRDSLLHHVRLNTVIHSVAGGIQQDIPLTSRANLQAEFQFRELYQTHQQAVFDFLPGLTASYVVTPRAVLFANALLQMRGKKYFQAPTKEIDPFYTWGGLYQRGGWTFSASSTLVQNFREPFRHNATIPVNNYSFILDFEVARRLFKQIPGIQAFLRAEPIYNFHSHNRPGLAGMDFRLFWGLRMAMSKPALTATLEQLRQQLEEQEATPPGSAPKQEKGQPKPSAFIAPHEVIAGTAQPIHGFLSENSPNQHLADTAFVEGNTILPLELTSRAANSIPKEQAGSGAVSVKPAVPSLKAPFNMVLVPPFPSIRTGDEKPFEPNLIPLSANMLKTVR